MTAQRMAFWALFVVTLTVYLTMVLWSLPKISDASGGSAPLDMRPLGYAFAETKAFIAALPPDAAEFYLTVQHRLDAVYPALLAATLFFAIRALTPPRFPVAPWLVALISLPGAAFDHLENAAVADMLSLGAEGVTPDLVAHASLWTVLKSAFTSLAMLLLLVFAAVWLWRRVTGRKPHGHAA